MACLLAGYPPWYRSTVKTRARIKIKFPMQSTRDITRAGWILAIGLLDPSIPDQTPPAVCCADDDPPNPGPRREAVSFRAAVERCRNHLRNHVQPHFASDPNIRAAVQSLTHLVDSCTGSGMPVGPDYGAEWTPAIPPLSGQQCAFAMANFNGLQPLSDADVVEMRPILLPVVAAAVYGAYEAVQYLKDVGVALKKPSGLRDMEKEVYLRDCVTRLPLKQ